MLSQQKIEIFPKVKKKKPGLFGRRISHSSSQPRSLSRPKSSYGSRTLRSSQSTRTISRPQTASAHLPTLPSDRPLPHRSMWRSRSTSSFISRRTEIDKKLATRPQSAAVGSRPKQSLPSKRPKSRQHTSSWKSLNDSKPKPINEVTKVLNRIHTVLRWKQDIEPSRGVPPERQLEFLGESKPTFKRLMELLPQNESNSKIIAILEDYESLTKKLNDNCSEGKAQIAQLQKTNNQLHQSNKKLQTECADLQKAVSPKSSESIIQQDNHRKVIELEQELEERAEKFELARLNLREQISKLTMQLEKQEKEEKTLRSLLQDEKCRSAAELGRRTEDLFKSETPTRFVLAYGLSLEKTDAELHSTKEAFGWEKCSGRFPGNVELSRNACFYRCPSEAEAENMVKVGLDGDAKFCYAREYPCDKVIINTKLSESFIRTWLSPFGSIRNFILGDDFTIIRYRGLKSACAALVFLSGRKIADDQSNKQIVMNMDFANDTRHMKEQWRFHTNGDEEEFMKAQEGGEKFSLSYTFDQISDFKIEDYDDEKVEKEIPKDIPVSFSQEELDNALAELTKKLDAEAKQRETELNKIIEHLKNNSEQKDKILDRARGTLEDERVLSGTLKKSLVTQQHLHDRKLVREIDDMKDPESEKSSAAHILFLEQQIRKLEIERDQLESQLLPDNEKPDSLISEAKLKRLLNLANKELSQVKNNLEQKYIEVETLRKELESIKSQMSPSQRKISIDNSGPFSPLPRDVDSLNKEKRELLIENAQLREQLSCVEVENAKERLEISKKLEDSQNKLRIVEDEIQRLREVLKQDITRADLDLAKLNGSPDGGLDRCASAELYNLHDRLAQKIKEERELTIKEQSTALESKKSNDRLVSELRIQVKRLTRELTELKATFDSQVQKACEESGNEVFSKSKMRVELEEANRSMREKLMGFERNQEIFDKLKGISDDGSPSSISQTQRIMADIMKDRDDVKIKYLALEKDYNSMQEMSKKNESIFEETKEGLKLEIADLKSQIRKMMNELSRVANAEGRLKDFEREVRVEEMFETRSKQNEVERPPSRPRSSDHYDYNAPVTDPEADRRKLIKMIESLKKKNRKLDRNFQKFQLATQAQLKSEFQDMSPKAKFRHAVTTVIKHKTDQILRIGVSKNPPPKEKRVVEAKYKMTPSRFLKIMKGEPSKRPLKAKRWLQRTMVEIYDRKLAADRQAKRENLPLLPLPEFIYHEYIPSRFGLTELVDVMCWDIHHAVEKYGPESREIRTFKKFLEEEYPTRALSFYLGAREVILQATRENDSQHIDSILFRQIVDSVFFNTSASFQDDLAERLEFEGLFTNGQPKLDAHAMLELFVLEYIKLHEQYKTQTIRLFFHMGLHQKEKVEFEDYLPSIRVILAGIPEEKVQEEISRLRMPASRMTPIQQFVALTDRFSDLRLQFVLSEIAPDYGRSKDVDALYKHVDVHWRSFEADVLKRILPLMNNLTTPYEHMDQIRSCLNSLKDISQHLNMALLHRSVWDSFQAYCTILCKIQCLFTAFEVTELRKSIDISSARALLGPLEEFITSRFNRIMKKAKASSNPDIHKRPHYVINSSQFPSVDDDTAAQRLLLERFASSLSSTKMSFHSSDKSNEAKYISPKWKNLQRKRMNCNFSV